MNTRFLTAVLHGAAVLALAAAILPATARASDNAEQREKARTALGLATISYAPHTDIALKMRGAVQPYKNMKVEVTDDAITLSGSVESRKEKEAVLRLAQKMGGGRVVRDELRVAREEGAADAAPAGLQAP